MRTILDYLNIKPTDEKILTANPRFHKASEDMELKQPEQQAFEMTEFTVFRDEARLKEAVSTLVENGFLHSEISTYVSHDGSLLDHKGKLKESKLGEGLLLGIAIGSVAGALFGLLSSSEFFTPFRAVPIPRFFSMVLFAVIW